MNAVTVTAASLCNTVTVPAEIAIVHAVRRLVRSNGPRSARAKCCPVRSTIALSLCRTN